MKKRRLSPQNITMILIALIGMVGTVIAAYFAYRGNTAAAELTLRSALTREAEASLVPGKEPLIGKIRFASPTDPAALNPDLQWEAGSSEPSGYQLSEDGVRLTAGPFTWPNYPAIYYRAPFEGDFEVQVKLVFSSPISRLNTAQMAGLVILPRNARLVAGDSGFPADWAVASKFISDAGILVGCRGAWTDYSSDTVFLRVERKDDVWRCAYSENGDNWTRSVINLEADALSGRQLETGLFAYSDTADSITVEFSDWSLTRK